MENRDTWAGFACEELDAAFEVVKMPAVRPMKATP
jgi:hypothetical protein